jgi:hypothetical protein
MIRIKLIITRVRTQKKGIVMERERQLDPNGYYIPGDDGMCVYTHTHTHTHTHTQGGKT